MTSPYSPASRAERLIAGGRVILAASSLFAVWLDPTEPAKFAAVAYGLLAAYLVYAVAIALWVARSAAVPGPQRLLSHAFDLAFFSLFTYFTAGPASPFIAYFVFSLVCATLRWQWRGTFWTALVALATFLGLGVYFAEVLRDPSFELMPFIIRAVYLVVFAVLLGYLGVHEERTRREMALLAAWPAPGAARASEVTRELLATSARILGAPRAVAAWVDGDEPWLYLASWSAEDFSWKREAPAALEPLVAEPLAGASFLCPDPRREPPAVIYRRDGRVGRWWGPPLHAALRSRLGDEPLLSVSLAGEMLEGRLFFVGKRGLTSDDLVLGEIVAGIVAARLDHVYLIDKLRAAAAAQERVRLARDLHDGVLQSFTGIGLRVAAARRLADDGAAPAAARLDELQRLLADEQRDLRFLIQELESPAMAEEGGPGHLAARLDALVARIEQTWELRVALRMRDLPAVPSNALAREVYNMVREAVINAARHGGASRVEVEVRGAGPDRLAIVVADDGCGFPFRGRFDFAELRARDLGPRTLRARLQALGGELSLDSGAGGARLEMLLPREVASA
jgi:signal transduction histidine kinase